MVVGKGEGHKLAHEDVDSFIYETIGSYELGRGRPLKNKNVDKTAVKKILESGYLTKAGDYVIESIEKLNKINDWRYE